MSFLTINFIKENNIFFIFIYFSFTCVDNCITIKLLTGQVLEVHMHWLYIMTWNFYDETHFNVSVGVLYSPKAGAESRSRLFFSSKYSQRPIPWEKEGFSKYVANLPHRKPRRTKERCVSVCVSVCVHVKWVPEDQQWEEAEGGLQATLSQLPFAYVCVHVCVCVFKDIQFLWEHSSTTALCCVHYTNIPLQQTYTQTRGEAHTHTIHKNYCSVAVTRWYDLGTLLAAIYHSPTNNR